MSIVLLILKIILYIILAVLGIVVVVLCLPVGAEAGFVGKKLTYKVRWWFLNIYDSDGKGIGAWGFKQWKKIKSKKKPDKPEKIPDPPDESDFIEPDEPEYLPELSEAENTMSAEPETSADAEPEQSSEPEKSTNREDAPESENSDPFEDESDEDSNEDSDDEQKSGKSLMDKIEFILGILEAADRPLLKILKGVKFSEVYIDFIIANEDAYKCALNYGRISGAVYNLLGWLGAFCNVKYKTVDINPGFAQKNSRWDISLRLSFRPVTLVIAGIAFLITYIFRIFIPEKLKVRKLKKLNAARQK